MRMWDLKFKIKELGQKATCEIIQEKYIVEMVNITSVGGDCK